MDPSGWTLSAVSDYWDAVADRYLDLFHDEFRDKPFDRDVLRRFAASLGDGARILDAGCGPCGHVTRLLADSGAAVTGVDISPRCVALARRQEPSLAFDVMDIADMVFEGASFDGVVAYYALHYLPKSRLGEVIREFARILRPGGRLLLVAKDGDEEGFIADPLEVAGKVFWCAVGTATLRELLEDNGFIVLDDHGRNAAAQEINIRRIYLIAERRPVITSGQEEHS